MSGTIRDRMAAWEHDIFVGRDDERRLFESLLQADSPDKQVVFVHGPGGVGKTTLLREFQYLSGQHDVACRFIDGRHIEPSPLALISALSDHVGGDATTLLDSLAGITDRYVLIIDTYELLRPLDGWLRRVLLPSLSDQVILVLAGREGPQLEWRSRPGLQRLIHAMPLRNFTPENGRVLLNRLQVPQSQFDAVLGFTHGHPLALALAADICAQQPDATFDPESAINIIQALLERLTSEASEPAQREALEAASIVRSLTEPLLAAILGVEDVRDVFEWLVSLSCIELDRDGARPHDLARDALSAELRWRNPDRFATFHERARHYYYRQFYSSSVAVQQQVLLDLLFLHRDNPVVKPFFDWQATGAMTADALRVDDLTTLLEMVRRHEGAESARLAAYWFERHPEQTVVFREEEQVQGFMSLVPLHAVSPQDLEADPATAQAAAHLEQTAPLRPGEVATLFRFWMDAAEYQSVTPVQSLVFLNAARHYLSTPGLAYTYFPCADSEFWAPFFAYGDLTRTPEADFEVDGRRYGVYSHDWRARPPMPWLQLLADREMSLEPTPPAAPKPALLVLSQPDFFDAVRAALRNLHRPDQLVENPLLRSRLIVDRVGEDAENALRAASLEALITTTSEQLEADPRTARGYRALYRTYIQPAPTQEQAAELLDLPFSTYRRHLGEGIDHLTELLWQLEIGETVATSI